MRSNPDFYPVIDFSYWNTAATSNAPSPTINPELMLEQGIKAVILRAGKGIPEMSSDHGIDRHWYQNVQRCQEAGLTTMAYWRIFDLSFEPAEHQALRFIEALSTVDHPNYGPVWIDCEEHGIELGRILVEDWIMKFAETLRSAGYHNVGIYTRRSWWNPRVLESSVQGGRTAYPLWVAHWVDPARRTLLSAQYSNPNTWDEFVDRYMSDGPDLPDDWNRWDIWQFVGEGSSLGKTFGFASEHLDCNLIRSSTFHRWFGD